MKFSTEIGKVKRDAKCRDDVDRILSDDLYLLKVRVAILYVYVLRYISNVIKFVPVLVV